MRSFPIYSEDLNVFKVFTLPNGQRIRFETSFGNLFNRTLFGEPANNWSAANFGQVFSQANSPRSIQMALRYDFWREQRQLANFRRRQLTTGESFEALVWKAPRSERR